MALRPSTESSPGTFALIAVTGSRLLTRPGLGVTTSAAVGAWFGGGGGGWVGSVLGIASALPAEPSRIAAVSGSTAVRRVRENIRASVRWVRCWRPMLGPRAPREYAR